MITRIARHSIAGAVAALLASDAAALWDQHQLDAQAGLSSANDSNVDLADTSVDALYQTGVPGVDDFAYFAHASADSDRGVLLVDSLIDWGPGALYYHASSTSIASVEQWLDVQWGGTPVTVTLNLDFDGAADVEGQASASSAARLDIGSLCEVWVAIRSLQDPEILDDCTGDYSGVSYVASGGPSNLSVVVTFTSNLALPTHIELHAQLESQLQVGAHAGDVATAFGSGALSVEVAGAYAYHFGTPTFLTVPEPGDAALAVAALAALAVEARRRARH